MANVQFTVTGIDTEENAELLALSSGWTKTIQQEQTIERKDGTKALGWEEVENPYSVLQFIEQDLNILISNHLSRFLKRDAKQASRLKEKEVLSMIDKQYQEVVKVSSKTIEV